MKAGLKKDLSEDRIHVSLSESLKRDIMVEFIKSTLTIYPLQELENLNVGGFYLSFILSVNFTLNSPNDPIEAGQNP